MSVTIFLLLTALICVFPILAAFLGAFIYIVPEHERLVLVPRYGDFSTPEVRGPGFVFFNPFQVQMSKIDLREKVLEIEVNGVSKPESRKFRLNAAFGYRITDPLQWVKRIKGASADDVMKGMAMVILIDIVQNYITEEIIARQPEIEEKWRYRLMEETGFAWGVKVTLTEIRKMTRTGLEVEDQ